ncbi:MAG: D-glycerate dehydrogenase [Chloroflexi bacterium]|nr:D-glycerate dehydrogenase [Chloroflexota bacterium]
MTDKVLITQKIYDGAAALLDEAGLPYHYNDSDETLAPEALQALAAEATALVCLLPNRIDTAVLNAAPHLKIIANVAVGYDNIDVAAATERGIVVTNTPDVLTETTADLAFALLLALARRVVAADAYMRAGKYTRFELFPEMLGVDVYGKTLGIVGLGRIGTAVARRGALGFGMKVIYTANNRKAAVEEELGAQRVTFPELLAESDFISINVPLTPQTRHLFTLAEFQQMKPSAFIINTARGPIIKEADLAAALAQGLIRGAALDVFEEEPLMHPGLAQFHDRLIVTPHIGSASVETRQNMSLLAVRNVLAVLSGKRPLSSVQ